MAEAWNISRRTRTCAATGARIDPGRPFYSALIEKADGFERRDYDAEAWPGVDKEQFFSYWKNKSDDGNGEPKQRIDFERVLVFFDSLEGSDEPARKLLRYVLALVLVRKRHLRLDETSRTPEGDRLKVFDRRRGGRTLEIVSPEATVAELMAAQEQLNQLFEYDFGAEGA